MGCRVLSCSTSTGKPMHSPAAFVIIFKIPKVDFFLSMRLFLFSVITCSKKARNNNWFPNGKSLLNLMHSMEPVSSIKPGCEVGIGLHQWFSTTGRDLQRSRELFLEGSRVDILCTQLYYLCFIRVSDGVFVS